MHALAATGRPIGTVLLISAVSSPTPGVVRSNFNLN
jgi:hypothetical protein